MSAGTQALSEKTQVDGRRMDNEQVFPASVHLVPTADLTPWKTQSVAVASSSSMASRGTSDGAPAGHLSLQQPTPLINRTVELATIRVQLTDGRVRLLTLTGPAGVGKTRLALAAASQLTNAFPAGILLVNLAPVHAPAAVLPTIGQALGITDSSSTSLLERFGAHIDERALLVVLDNFEHVLSAANQIADLLAICPYLVFLVTSRVPLHLRWEHIVRVAPLPVPDLTRLPKVEVLSQVPSVTLFLERARAHQSNFVLTEALGPIVAQLVVDLDGLPLALELAAARLDALPLHTIVRFLSDRLHVLATVAPDVPERQHSLEAALGWSYDLLSSPAQRVFRVLGVFRGRVASSAVAAALGETRREMIVEVLISLVEGSLIVRGQEDEEDQHSLPAFRLLETIRQYAREQLEREGELHAAEQAHALYFLALAERAHMELHGSDQRAWFFRLELENDNLRAALRWLLDQNDPTSREAALHLAGMLGYFWRFRGYHREGLRWLEEALVRAPGADAAVRIQALLEAGALLTLQAELERARSLLVEARDLASQLNDAVAVAQSLAWLANCALVAGAVDAIALLEEALMLAQEAGDPRHIATVLYYLSVAAQARGEFGQATTWIRQAMDQLAATANVSQVDPARHNFLLGSLLAQQGDLSGAVRHIQEGLAGSVSLRDRYLLSLGTQAALAVIGECADPPQRAKLLGASDAIGQAAGAALTVWEQVTDNRSIRDLRELLARGEWAENYHEGRSLSITEVATLTAAMLDELARTLTTPQSDCSAGTTQESQKKVALSENPLTEREREVLRLVAQGQSNKDIARQLVITTSTVNYHLTSIFNKLGVDTRAQAVAVTAQQGFI